jgi:hypothetical protein
MSDKELSRINVIQAVVEKRMRRRDAHQLALTERQTQRLSTAYVFLVLKDWQPQTWTPRQPRLPSL